MTTLTLARRDTVDSEYSAGYYRLGCEVNPIPLGCLSCPLPACKYDEPLGLGEVKRRERAQLNRDRALELLGSGLTVADVAARLGLSTRVIFRYKVKGRAARQPSQFGSVSG